MAKAKLKTQPTRASVSAFLESITDEQRRKDIKAIARIMKKVTKSQPKMWGKSIVGYGKYQYKYASGREGEWFVAGFSPRKQDITIYVMSGFSGFKELLAKLGKHKTGKSCLYIKRLADIDTKVLEQIVSRSVAHMKKPGS